MKKIRLFLHRIIRLTGNMDSTEDYGSDIWLFV